MTHGPGCIAAFLLKLRSVRLCFMIPSRLSLFHPALPSEWTSRHPSKDSRSMPSGSVMMNVCFLKGGNGGISYVRSSLSSGISVQQHVLTPREGRSLLGLSGCTRFAGQGAWMGPGVGRNLFLTDLHSRMQDASAFRRRCASGDPLSIGNGISSDSGTIECHVKQQYENPFSGSMRCTAARWYP